MTAQASVEIVEQPASNAFRFRYASERRTHGSIPGVNSTPTNKTFPKIRIIGPYRNGRVIVSCVTKDELKAHPHRVVSKDSCATNGIYITQFDSNEIEFKTLGIQCVKRRDIKRSLEERKEAGVDPYGMGFENTEISVDDMNTVRLCFQVYLEPPENCPEQTEIELEPVVSDPIHDRQSIFDLVICHLSSAVASVAGGTVLIILCHKVIKDNISVRFFEQRNDQVVWQSYGKFQPKDVYDQSAIVLLTPAYYTQDVDHPIDISVQLVRPSTNESGKAVPLQLLPLSSMSNKVIEAETEICLKRKRDNFKRVDSLEHPNKASCGCILAPIINPNCPIHNPQPKQFNQASNLIDNKLGYEPMRNVPQTSSKLFYYNQNTSTEGAMSLPKKSKYSETFVPPAYHTVQSTASNVPQIPLQAFHNPTQYQYQYRPVVVPNYHQPLPSPNLPQCMYQSPFPSNTTPIVPDVPAVPFNNQREWQVQPEPTLQPITVELSQQQTQPSSNYDYNSSGQIDRNQNLLDFDIDDGINQLSDSLDNALNLDEEGFEVFDEHEPNHNNVSAMNVPGVYDENDYAVQGILNATRNQKTQNQPNYLANTWL